MKDIMNLYSGETLNVLAPKEEEIDIIDIAHALSLLCRGNGQIKHFYSVGQHSINCAKEARARGYSKRVQLGCLLHDGSEAYLSDVIRPIKKHLGNYYEIEKKFQNLIYEKYIENGLSEAEEKLVKEIDDVLLYNELNHLMINYNKEAPSLKEKISFESGNFEEVKEEFLNLFKEKL